MKKIFCFCLILLIFTSSCANEKVIDGIKYDTYGVLNKDEKVNPNIQYELVWGNIIWGVILIETIVAPIYFFGFSMWEPTGPKSNPRIKGQVFK